MTRKQQYPSANNGHRWVSCQQHRKMPLDDGLILEVVGQVALNTLTNYVNRVAGTEVDFPLLKLDAVA